MTHSLYVYLLSQISFQNQAELIVDDTVIAVTVQGDVYTLSSQVSSSIPTELSLRKNVAVDCGGELALKEEGLFLIQEVKKLDQFTCFKTLIYNYCKLISFWKEVFKDLEMALPRH